MQLVPQAMWEQERAKLLDKIYDDFQKVCQSMDNIHKDMSQHIKDICQMKIEVSQMQGKATIKSHEATTLWDMIQKDRDAINKLINMVHKLKDYTKALGQIEVVNERFCSMDFHISKLQMRPSTQVLEDWLARLENRLQDQYEEIVILQGQICCCGQQGDFLVNSLISSGLIEVLVPPVSPPVAGSSEEEKSELDYDNDPPIPCIEGTVQGKSVSPSQFSES